MRKNQKRRFQKQNRMPPRRVKRGVNRRFTLCEIFTNPLEPRRARNESLVYFVRNLYKSSRTAQGAERIVGLLRAKSLQILSNRAGRGTNRWFTLCEIFTNPLEPRRARNKSLVYFVRNLYQSSRTVICALGKSRYGQARIFSENRNPFVRVADISPNRGITCPYAVNSIRALGGRISSPSNFYEKYSCYFYAYVLQFLHTC